MKTRSASEVVGDPTAEQQQTPEGQGVGAQDPLAVGDRDVQSVLGRRQRHDDDGGVEDNHQLGDANDRESPVTLGSSVLTLARVLR